MCAAKVFCALFAKAKSTNSARANFHLSPLNFHLLTSNMRISGINIPKEKKIEFSLRYVFGIGPTLARKVLQSAKIDGNIRTKDLTDVQQDTIRAIVEKTYKIEGDLRREIQSNIKAMKDIKCFRGVRHMKHLPVRGQRTKTNSRTVRGNVRKTAVSGKKKEGLKT